MKNLYFRSVTLQATGRQQEALTVITKTTDFLLEIGNTDLHALCEVFQAELAPRQGCASQAYDRLAHLPPLPSTPVLRYYAPQLTLPRILVNEVTSSPHTTGMRVHSPMEIEEFSIPLSNREIEG
jgi:hypothetical protein